MSSIAGVLVDNNFPLQGKSGPIVAAPECRSTGVNFLQADVFAAPIDVLSQPIPKAGTYLVTTQIETTGRGASFDARYGSTMSLIGKLTAGPEVSVASVGQIDVVIRNIGMGNYDGNNSALYHSLVTFTGPGDLFVRIEPGFYSTATTNTLVGGSCVTATKVDLVAGSAIVV